MRSCSPTASTHVDEALGQQHPQQPARCERRPARDRPTKCERVDARARDPALRGERHRRWTWSASVAPGELVALVGVSGSGDDHCARRRLRDPDSGRVMLTDESGRRHHTRKPQRRGSMVFQHYAPSPHMTVESNVAFRARGARRGKLRAAGAGANRRRGARRKTRQVQALSGGEQQRRTARALVISPRVLLLDEPPSNLDPRPAPDVRRAAPDAAARGHGAVRDARSGGRVRRGRPDRDVAARETVPGRDARGYHRRRRARWRSSSGATRCCQRTDELPAGDGGSAALAARPGAGEEAGPRAGSSP